MFFFILFLFRVYIGFILIMFSTSFWKVDDWGKSPVVDQKTPTSRNQVNIIVILWIYHDRYVLLIYFFPQFIAFTSVMFCIFLLQTTDSAYETTWEKSIAFDVDELMCDAGIGSSLDPIEMIEKTLRKINEDILCLLFIQPQTDEIRTKVDVFVKRSHALKVSCKILNHNINSFSTL